MSARAIWLQRQILEFREIGAIGVVAVLETWLIAEVKE